MYDYNTKLVAAALQQVGKPYVWGARGEQQWGPAGPQALPSLAFDCSGLVLYAALRAGSKDRTMMENAQTMFDSLKAPGLASSPHLRFYGKAPDAITHVAVGFYVHGAGGLLVVEAAGGGSDMKTIEIALANPHARVRVGPEQRQDYVSSRRLPFW